MNEIEQRARADITRRYGADEWGLPRIAEGEDRHTLSLSRRMRAEAIREKGLVTDPTSPDGRLLEAAAIGARQATEAFAARLDRIAALAPGIPIKAIGALLA